MGESSSFGLGVVLGVALYGYTLLYILAGLVTCWLLARRRWVIGGTAAVVIALVATVPWWLARQDARAAAAVVLQHDLVRPLPAADSFRMVVVAEDRLGSATVPFMTALAGSGAISALGWSNFAWRDNDGMITAPFWRADPDYTALITPDADGINTAAVGASVTDPDLVLLVLRPWDDVVAADLGDPPAQVTRFVLFAPGGDGVSLDDDRLWQAHSFNIDLPVFPYNPNNRRYFSVRAVDAVLADLTRALCQAATACDPQALPVHAAGTAG